MKPLVNSKHTHLVCVVGSSDLTWWAKKAWRTYGIGIFLIPHSYLSCAGLPQRILWIRKKCFFLTEVAQSANINVKITNGRLEQLPANATADIVTARALAPLSKLLGYVYRRLRPGGVAFLHKGATVEQELTPACKDWKMHLRKHQSQTDPNGMILEVRDLVPSHAH